jgi:hypothetical protein
VLGDIITGLNGKPIKLQKDLFGILDDCKVPARCFNSCCRASQHAAAQARIGSSAGRVHLESRVATHGCLLLLSALAGGTGGGADGQARAAHRGHPGEAGGAGRPGGVV